MPKLRLCTALVAAGYSQGSSGLAIHTFVMGVAFAAIGNGSGTAGAPLVTVPLWRVVSKLLDTTRQVAAVGKRGLPLYGMRTGHCSSGSSGLSASSTAAGDLLPQVTGALWSVGEMTGQFGKDPAVHKESLAFAKGKLANATSLRDKGAACYIKGSSGLVFNIAATREAIVAIGATAAAMLRDTATRVMAEGVRHQRLLGRVLRLCSTGSPELSASHTAAGGLLHWRGRRRSLGAARAHSLGFGKATGPVPLC